MLAAGGLLRVARAFAFVAVSRMVFERMLQITCLPLTGQG